MIRDLIRWYLAEEGWANAAADAVTVLFGMIGLYAGVAALMAMLP